MLKKSTQLISDMIFPRSCLRCNVLLSIDTPDTYLCKKCRMLVPMNTLSRCAFCPRAATLWNTCATCRPMHALDALLVASDYQDQTIKRMVKALKYRFATVVAYDIGEIMAQYFEQRASLIGISTSRNIEIASIPLHPRRLRWRGFNQAELIADAIAKYLDLHVRHDLLKRTQYKIPQADIEDRSSRIANANGIFSLASSAVEPLTAVQPLEAKTILLVDDVATTGSTLDNAARVLKSAGAKRVIGFVFARG